MDQSTQEDQKSQEWERLALKLLKGKPLSSLNQTLLSGLTTKVVYASRPTVTRSVYRQDERWRDVVVSGRIDGRFQHKKRWLEQSSDGLGIVRMLTDDRNKVQRASRIEVLDMEMKSIEQWSRSGLGTLHCDPFALVLLDVHTESGVSESVLQDSVRILRTQEGAHPITIDASLIHGMGGSAQEELLWVLLSLSQLLKWGCLDWSSIWLQLALDADIVQNTVKVRALRQLMQGMAAQRSDVVGSPFVNGETSLRMFTLADSHNNMLRSLYAAVGGIWGGTDGISIHGYDVLSNSSRQAHRIEQNEHRVLDEESGLGNWLDPMFGGYEVETQTQALCEQVWSEFCMLEETGGILNLLSGEGWLNRLTRVQSERHHLIATQQRFITGVTAFADANEQIGNDWLSHIQPQFVRDAQPIEQLRAMAEQMPGVKIQVYCLGALSEYKPRLDFLQQWLAVVGWKAEIVEAVSALNGDLRCVVGTEVMYQQELDGILEVLLSIQGPVWVVGNGTNLEHENLTRIRRGLNQLSIWNRVFQQMTVGGDQ